MIRTVRSALALTTAALLFGCGSSTAPGSTSGPGSASPDGSTPDGSGGTGSGRMTTLLTDAPLDEQGVTAVYVTVSSVQANIDEAWVILAEGDQTFDLLQLRNGVTAVLGEQTLPPGAYTEIRMILAGDGTITVNGVDETLFVPSGAQTGIKIPYAFEIDPQFDYRMTLDFDAEQSVHKAGSTWIMQPVVLVKSFETITPDDGTAGDGTVDDGTTPPAT